MKKIDIGQSLQTIENLGVLPGICLPVYELTHTRELARAQCNIDRGTAFQISEIELSALVPYIPNLRSALACRCIGVSVAT